MLNTDLKSYVIPPFVILKSWLINCKYVVVSHIDFQNGTATYSCKQLVKIKILS